MLAATAVGVLFVLVVAVTWLSSRADESRAHCRAMARHIDRQLEIPPTSTGHPTDPRTPGIR